MTARAAVIMAAGQGTRMKSRLPKVLHTVGGRSLLDRVIDTVQAAGCERIHVVVGNHSPAVRELVVARLGEDAIVVQDPPQGTGHAVLCAKGALADFDGDVLVVNGDCPLLTAQDLEPLFNLRAKDAALALMAFEPVDPLLYGRVLRGAGGHVMRIVEPSQASDEVKAVRTCNAGMYLAGRADLFRWLANVRNDNPKNEYFLTDIVAEAVHEEAMVRAHVAPESSVMGADTPMQLAQAEAEFQKRRRAFFLAEGVQMTGPDTVYFAWDTQVAPGAVVEPYVVFAPGVKVETAAVIRAFSHLEGCVVREGALIGPYARLRPGADIGEHAHIGNFVEVKKVAVGRGAKANHLSYLGDGSVGAGANIGAGTIFCNYDGFFKYDTHVGEGAFVGSNSALVAPVTIGAGAYTGSGSVITKDVAPDALALGRGQQVEKAGWAARFREVMGARKAKGK
ncbi:bifunctional UDP-N-acetylglucosamine diphosphorylase/glucosamine-1-phosphate N-acetyltransferase GlmU [Phenylobacterium sp.]|uniref:bifunctional UDP-N-acetylglucosamine diphosphorylase/glucosamine-1-phosphate N-acetyltransferase GlmU n=1 Tax=Phenylobacterium sp. TaxID=1871053 RepID=UPI0025E29064|nr:bifunctional UDP-N-acetylglucosamine diphosphorylase/glucosamine-1-phosphate N-acetyltransferase GlmU [Phenylobacterium sp.]MBX3484020.1 bifunctional UDP-N-acetylglucosamine diphosphorylase/glucosamine-1-phosphate N-acetyltransferase GlmU [Phenylobacterium sp.]